MEDIFSKSTVNEMERAISDLKSENLRLKLDLGIKHDRDTTSVDESLRSVDEEVQEVTAVRLVLKEDQLIRYTFVNVLSSLKSPIHDMIKYMISGWENFVGDA